MTTTRTLLVLNDADYFFSHRRAIAEAARVEGYDVHVALPFRSDDIRFHGLPYPVHPIPLERGGVDPRRDLSTLVALVRLYRRLRPDLVHHVTIKPVLYGGLAARLTGIPTVIQGMTGLGHVFHTRSATAELLRRTLRHPLAWGCLGEQVTVLFQNPGDRDRFVDLGICRQNQTIIIRGSGVDLERFHPRSRDAEPEERPLVVLGSRMLWDKGVGEFVEAARRLHARGVKARWVLLGGTDANPLSIAEHQLRAWEREGVVEWWGHRDDMAEVLRRASVACLPSHHEGLPKFLLEAAASGLPIVATDIPGCRQIVSPGINGLLVPIDDAPALADALAILVDDPDTRAAMGARSRALAEDGLGVDAVMRLTMRLYAEKLRGVGISAPVRRECPA